MVDELDDIQHELIREALRLVGVNAGHRDYDDGRYSLSRLRPRLVQYRNRRAPYTHCTACTATWLGQKRWQNRPVRLRSTFCKPIGIQDQYIAALGGLRLMEFTTRGRVCSERIQLSPQVARQLNENTMLFFTGVTRRSETILREQQQNIGDRQAVLCEMKQMAYTARDALVTGAVDHIGELLHQSWQLKKQLATDISNGTLDEAYSAARRAGALGGKITGAGGGGFLLLYCPHGKQDTVRSALSGMQELPFRMEADGSKVIFNYQRQ
jgi:D-glycero-alpha-D-manno-heptose-7-phosphate kinase